MGIISIPNDTAMHCDYFYNCCSCRLVYRLWWYGWRICELQVKKAVTFYAIVLPLIAWAICAYY